MNEAVERIRAALAEYGADAAIILTRPEIDDVLAHIDAQSQEIERLRADAARYRWLRNQHWTDNTLCVVARPKEAIRLGHDAPSGDRLDELIDAAMEYKASESEGRNDYI